MGILTPQRAGIVPMFPWKMKCPARHHGCLEKAMDVLEKFVRVPRGIA